MLLLSWLNDAETLLLDAKLLYLAGPVRLAVSVDFMAGSSDMQDHGGHRLDKCVMCMIPHWYSKPNVTGATCVAMARLIA